MIIVMKIDLHITTCHHHDVKCRERPGLKSWTQDERVKMSKLAVRSIEEFAKLHNHEVKITILDDGSDNENALLWLSTIDCFSNIQVRFFSHRGSSAGINDHMAELDDDVDLIVHIEDDHIMFNPLDLDWATICYDFLNSQEAKENNIAVITFRSGLPSDKDNPGYHNAWGPIGFIETDKTKGIIFPKMGNAHHVMLPRDYKKLLPLVGSSGDCEAAMNDKLSSLGLKNVELQEYIYAFHTHTYEGELPDPVTSEDLNLSGAGIEYGLMDIYFHLRHRSKIDCSVYVSPDNKERKVFDGDYKFV